MSLPLRVLGSRVLIRPDVQSAAPEQTASGLYVAKSLAAAATGDDAVTWYVSGTVAAKGQKCTVPDLNVGDPVTFSWEAGQEIQVNGEPFLVMDETEVLAVLKETA